MLKKIDKIIALVMVLYLFCSFFNKFIAGITTVFCKLPQSQEEEQATDSGYGRREVWAMGPEGTKRPPEQGEQCGLSRG